MASSFNFRHIFGTEKPIIGMIHLKPLPGAPGYRPEMGMPAIIEAAEADARRLIEGGIDAVQIENQGDRPFLKPAQIGFETVAAVTAVVSHLRQRFQVPMGVNIHLNGVKQALAIAAATGCQWVRAFELANAYIAEAGVIEAAGPQALRYRRFLQAENRIMILGDFHVKHGSHQITADKSLIAQAQDVEAALADGLILTGHQTGSPPRSEDLATLRKAIKIPMLIGSGLSRQNIQDLLPLADGAIVGSCFKPHGDLRNPVDGSLVESFMKTARIVRGDA